MRTLILITVNLRTKFEVSSFAPFQKTMDPKKLKMVHVTLGTLILR